QCPVHWEVARPPSWWAMVFACAADATLFASLLFGALFLWLVAPGWPPPRAALPGLSPALVAAVAVIIPVASSRIAMHRLQGGASPAGALAAGIGAQLAAAGAFAWLAASVPAPTDHAAFASQ